MSEDRARIIDLSDANKKELDILREFYKAIIDADRTQKTEREWHKATWNAIDRTREKLRVYGIDDPANHLAEKP